MRKLFVLLSLLVVASMVLAACGAPPPATEEPAATEPAGPPATEEPAATEPPAGEFTSEDPTTFVAVTFGEPETLDPALDYETAGGQVIDHVYDTLVTYDGPKADTFVPALAESWEVSEDGLTYTFTIREGVTFHEGGELTPSDVAYSFQRGLLQGGYASPQWLLAEPFFGVGNDDITCVVDGCASADDREALSANDPATLVAACEQVKSAIVADDGAGTVTMTLAQSWGPFIATIANNWGSVMDMEWVVENGGWDGSCDTWQNFYAMTSEDDPFTAIANGTGPFILDHWTPGEEIVLVRNDDYWRGPALLERFVIRQVDEFGTRFAMLQAGDADTITAGSQADYPQLDPLVGEECIYNADTLGFDCSVIGDGAIRVYKGYPTVIHSDVFFNFNINTQEGGNTMIGSGTLDGNGIPPDFFSDVHIRKAFNYCFDWELFISDVLQGEGVQTLVVPVAGMPGYDANAPHYTYDLAKCEEEFKLADLDGDGIPAGTEAEDGGDVWNLGFRFSAVYNQGNTQRQTVAEILSSNLGQVNDKFEISTLGLPWPAFLRAQREGTLPTFISGWLEDIHDPHNWYQPYLIGTYGRRQNLPEEMISQYQELLNQGVSEIDPAARAEIYAQVNQMQYDNPSLILLATATGRRYEQRWVEGWYYNPILSGSYYYQVSKK
ncbi:MAG TPA: ABC transporter substrate-binding protein [Anaerolineales bacterium]|nr:ABC transporter substrate-binding protein [Anaerolineales bacterium]